MTAAIVDQGDRGTRLFQRRRNARLGTGKYCGRTSAIAIRFEPRHLAQLQAISAAHETSIAAIVRTAVAEYLEQREER